MIRCIKMLNTPCCWWTCSFYSNNRYVRL